MTIFSPAETQRSLPRRSRIAALVLATVCFVSSGLAMPRQPRLGVSPLKPVDAAVLLLEAACTPLADRSDLYLRVETDWFSAADWRSQADLSTALRGRPFAVTVATHDAHTYRRSVLATAEIWLTAQGDLLTFRLGPGALTEVATDVELKRAVDQLTDRSLESVTRLLIAKGARLPPSDAGAARKRAEAFLRSIRALVDDASIGDVEFAEMPAPPAKAPWEPDPKPTPIGLYWTARASTARTELLVRIDAVSGHVEAAQGHPR